MQTFLTNVDYKKAAADLDNKRLGKQRVEAYQIMKALLLPEYGWKNHPAVKMWKGYELGLVAYQQAICNEWISRGFKDTCLQKTVDIFNEHMPLDSGIAPPWLNDELCETHRSNLIRKDEAYALKFPDTKRDLSYIWPVQ